MSTAARDAQLAMEHQGRYAGPVTRLLAYLADLGIISVLFGLTLSLVSAAIEVATPWTISLSRDSTAVAVAYLAWAGIYFANGWMLRAKSPGMALLGLRIVRADGTELDRRHALIRVAAFPLGFLGIILGRNRQAIYDRIADTAVVYGWDARTAKLRAIARDRQESAGGSSPPA